MNRMIHKPAVNESDPGLSERVPIRPGARLTLPGFTPMPIMSRIILMITDICQAPDSNPCSCEDPDTRSRIIYQASPPRILFLPGAILSALPSSRRPSTRSSQP